MIKEILTKTNLQLSDIVAIYPYGSRVYGNARKNSDYDFIIITTKKTNKQYSDKLININFYTPEEHQYRLDGQEISALECYFLPQHKILFDRSHALNKNSIQFNYTLNLALLRHSLSAKSSNSWVKAKKKLTVEKDYDLDLGRKSLFHAFRIINFGIQIGTNGKIIDYGSCNDLFKEIMNCYTWDQMFKTYKQLYNERCTEFRILAPLM